ncbi:hypothetical protein FTUN_1663 [Frigoriglobus tundricola]|uniref:Uncharacterized protein n=1 Tax=Frigoriglobus tundricola TaxID=2774151 RepID=A0A6M5YKP2_9BACT|nr:hypothetical protein FTUN_1663 [Frigoriglobus tundricola]
MIGAVTLRAMVAEIGRERVTDCDQKLSPSLPWNSRLFLRSSGLTPPLARAVYAPGGRLALPGRCERITGYVC